MSRTRQTSIRLILAYLAVLGSLLYSSVTSPAQVSRPKPSIPPPPRVSPDTSPASAEVVHAQEKQKSFQETVKALGIKETDAAKLKTTGI